MTFQEYLKNRKSGSGTVSTNTQSSGSKFQSYLTKKRASSWADSADSFIQKIQNDYAARQKGGYQAPESIRQYKDSVSDELQDLLDGINYAKKYTSQITDEDEREEYRKVVSDTQNYLQSIGWRLDLEEKYWDKWDSEDSYNKWKKMADYQSLADQSDFAKYSQKGAAIQNPSYKEAQGWFAFAGNPVGGAKIENKVTYSRDNADNLILEQANGSTKNTTGNLMYTYMTDDEVSIYNYLLAKNGEEKADEYLEELTPYLNYRQGEKVADAANGSFLGTGAISVSSGLDQYISGVRGWFTEEAEPVSSTQIAAELARENIGSNIGKVAFDTGRVLGNVAPSIVLGSVTGGIGSAAGLGTAGVQMASAVGTGLSVGASAGGNDYQEALREGYSVSQARAYGLATGALEAGLQTVLGKAAGGAGKFTAAASTTLANAMKKASSKVAVKVGMEMLGEGFEEYMQEILNPVVRNLTLGEDNEFHLFTEEALYNGMLGMITGGLFSAAEAGASRISNPFFSVYGMEGSISTQTDESGNVLGYLHFNRKGDIDGYVRVAKDGEASIHKPFTSYENINAYAYVDQDGVTQYGRINENGELVTGSFNPNENASADAAGSVNVNTNEAAGNIPALYRLAEEAADNRAAANRQRQSGDPLSRDNTFQTNEAGNIRDTPATRAVTLSESANTPIPRQGGETVAPTPQNGLQGEKTGNTGVTSVANTGTNAVISVPGQGAVPVTVSGIGSVEDGSVQVSLSNGETVLLEDVTFESPETESLYYAASNYTTPTARAFVSGYTGELPLKTYKAAFDFIRGQAKEGVSFDTAVKQAGLAGQMMGLEAQQLAWYSGVNEAALQKSGENGTISTTKEGGVENGEEQIHIRQYQGSAGGPDGRGRKEDKKRSELSKRFGGIQKTSRKVAGRIQEEKQKQKITLSFNNGHFTFDSIHQDLLTSKQKALTQKSAEYGYDLHYFTKGTVFNDGEEDRVIDKQAFMIPGLNAIFAMDGQDIDFLYHELFHQFFDEDEHGERALADFVKSSIIKDSVQWETYRNRAKVAYQRKVPDELLIEEITADLCEYAMSGSEKMHSRLDRLFPDGMLEELAKQAREVFKENRKMNDVKGGGEKQGEYRYSLENQNSVDNEGNELSAEQTAFFEKSKVRFVNDEYDDGNGALLPVYHATYNEFTIFDRNKLGDNTDLNASDELMAATAHIGFWFNTQDLNKTNSFGGRAEKVYLNIKKPFQVETLDGLVGYIREESDGRVTPSEIGNSFVEWLESEGYDGVAVLNDSEFGGTSFVALYPEQIKRTNNFEPTDSIDIRFFLDDVTEVDIDSLTVENEALLRQVELLKQEFQLTEGHQVNKAAVEGMAAKILRQTKSRYDKDTLAKNLQTVFHYIANDPEANFQEALDALTDVAGSVLQESTSLNRDLYNEYADMRDYFRKTPLSLSEAAKAELLDGYAAFRSRNLGKLNLKSGGTLLDELWGEICEKWPQFFDPDIGEAEQPYVVVDALNAVKPAYINPYGMNNADAARDLAMQMYYEYFELPEVHTFADEHKAELEKLRAEYRRKLLEARSVARAQYDKRLEKVREQNAEKRRELSKKIRETEDAKRKQQLAAQYRRLMDRKAEQLERQKAKFRTQWENREANRKEREKIRKLRTRIRSIADELSKRLVKETDQKNIPENFKKPVAQLLQMLDFTTDRTNPNSQASRCLRDLQAAYAKLESATQGEETPLTDYFDPDILDMIEEVAGLVEGKRVVDLGIKELSRLKDLLKAISTIVHNAGRLFREDKAVTVAEAGKEAIRALNAKKQFRRAKIAEGKNNPLGFMGDLLNKGMLTPYYFFKQFEDTPVWGLFQKLYDGENVYVRLSNQALRFAREVMKKHGYWNWELHERKKLRKDEAISFRTVNGDEIKLTLGEMLSLYATARRENMVETHHLDKGGFTLGSKDGAQRGILFTSADFQKLCEMLAEEQMKCVDEMVEYLSTVCAEQGNEVSLKMFGIRKFQEKYYFPFKVSGNVIRSNPGESQDIRLKNRSFTKARTDRATAPLMIQDFFEVWAGHVEEMAMYNAFALPLEDFTRVWNYRYQGDPGLSVKFAIEGVFGKRANSYITNFLRDLNGGVLQPVGEEWFSKLTSKFKKVSVLANLSVAIQQVSAIVRATAMINPKYLAPRSISQMRLFHEYDEARKYVPVYVLKDWGYFDTNMTRGTYQRMIQQEYKGAGKIKGFFTDSNYRSDAYGILAQKGDEANWGQLWFAVKNETRDRHPEIQYGSEEFYQLAADRVTDIIRATQVYDSVFKRNEIMRSNGAAAKMATAFMAEPITNYNMLLDAAREAGSGKKGSKKKAAQIVVSVVLSMILGNLLKSVISAMRDDDDEKKDENGNIIGTRSFWDKYRDAVLDNLLDDPLSMIPFIKDIYSITQGYEVKRTDMELFQKLYYALTKLDSDKYTTAEKVDAVIGAVAALLGEPYANISRDTRAIYNTFFADNVNDGTAGYRGYLLYQSVLEGDKETYQELYNGYREDGKTDKEIQGVLRSALVTYNPLISESVAAKLDGDLNAYEADIQKMIQSGFQRETVLDAVKSFEQKLKTIAGYRVDGKTDEAEKALAKLFPPEVDEDTRKTIEARIDTLTEKKAVEPEKEEEKTTSSLYTYTDLCEAIERGDSSDISMILQDMQKNGKEDKTIRSQVTSYFKTLYLACYQNGDKEGMRKIRNTLYNLNLGYEYKDFDTWTKTEKEQ